MIRGEPFKLEEKKKNVYKSGTELSHWVPEKWKVSN